MREYLLDTNIYIDSYDRYYRKDFFPTYWQQLSGILNSHVVIPIIVRDEITKNDWFLEWLKIPDICDDWGVRCISRNDFFEEVKLTV